VAGAVQDRWELRRIDLNGGTDVALVATAGVSSEIRSVRWSRDGLWIYFTRNDSLYAIGKDGGQVFPRTAFVPRVTAFDFHLGGGRMVAEEPRVFTYAVCGQIPSAEMPVRPLVLRDSLSGGLEWTASERRFWRTGASFHSPRWSFDGTSVAYACDQNLAGDLDLFHGRVTQDRAPTFVGLQDDYVVYEGETFVLQLQATDPDGQSISFESPALYLPSGSIFDPQTGRFTWGYPLGAGSEFYVVFRALDGTGGVANRVVRLTVELGGGSGGCPFADTRSATGWREENSILGRSLTGALALDAYRLKYAPVINNGRIQIRLRENEQENTTLDRVRIVAVDHSPDVRAFAMGEKTVLGTRSPAHRVTSTSAGDITSSVDGTGGY
jgi:hypothetical protein